MADIAVLGELRDVEPIDMDNYQDAKEGFELPRKGKYTVQAPDSFPSSAFGRSNAGALKVQVDPTILGPTNQGFQIRFTSVSGKVYKRGGINVSQLGDYLRACNFRGRITNEQEQADAVETTVNKVYEVDTDWRAYHKATGFVVEGMENFPKDVNGNPQSWINHPTEKDENGDAVRVRANLVVKRFIPATQ